MVPTADPATARAAAADRRDFFAALARRVDGELRTDAYSRVLYSTDASIYQVEPYGVLIPRSAGDVQAAVEVAAEHRVPVLPRASGSSLAGQAVNRALVIDMTRYLDRVLGIDPEARTVRVEPGLVLDELNRRLRPHNLQFGPDPASSERAALGGVVSNNSTGAHSIRYGMTADHVRAAGVVLADGSTARLGPCAPDEIERRAAGTGLEARIYREIAALVADPANRETIRAGTPRHWRRCGGYNLDRFLDARFLDDGGISFARPPEASFNLAKLVCGGEGGLAVITDVTLGLVPVPRRTGLGIVHFAGLGTALEAVPAILETGPSAVELMDGMAMRLCRDVPAYARKLASFVDGEPEAILIVEYAGEEEGEVGSALSGLSGHLERRGAGATGVVPVTDPAVEADVWKVRKVSLGLLMSIRGDHKPIPFIEDAAVPVEHLAEYVARIDAFCRDLGTEVAYYGHASAGCLHVRPLIDAKRAAEVAKLPEITSFSVELLRGWGGSLSSEHGDGRARSWINERFFGPDLYRLYQRVKRTFDSDNLLNPGTVVDAPPMTESLRFGAGYGTVEIDTQLDFSADQGFARAVEMCNGAGVCRKLTAGTMCPSFMVTREEEHSTRGRANLLRAALSGALPAEELTGDRMAEALGLCIQCKACKAECPSSVDMAKIKTEVLAQRHAVHGVSWRDRIFGDVARWSRLGSGMLGPVLTALGGSRLGKAVLAWLGVARERSLPPFARRTFRRRWKQLEAEGGGGAEAPRGPLVLFVDTFSEHNHPEVAMAAAEVFAACGYRVETPRFGCCGRPALSKGLVGHARELARRTVDRLAPWAERGVPIVGLEPSCLLTLRDEYLDLLPDDPAAKRLAEHVTTFEEHLAGLAEVGEELPFARQGGDDRPGKVLLHGHCHQKALVGTGAAVAALSAAGYQVEEVDSGCCGMAGSFGYEAEHYDISLAMAERRLLPAVRDADEETLVVAAGTSCRHQIADGTDRRALHPAEALRWRLEV